MIISIDVPLNLLPPPSLPRFRPSELAAHVTVPEAAMNENDGLVFRENNVRLAGQLLVMEPVTKACFMKRPTDDHFGLCVLAAYAGHHPASGRGIDHIHDQATFFSADTGASIHGFMNSATALTAWTQTEFPNWR
jgi:hypothetical protein